MGAGVRSIDENIFLGTMYTYIYVYCAQCLCANEWVQHLTYGGVGGPYSPKDGATDLKKYVTECGAIKKAFELVAEHGPKQLNRYKTLIEGV